jgi:hypothetical protein
MNASSFMLFTITSMSPSLSRSAYAAPFENEGLESPQLSVTSLNVMFPIPQSQIDVKNATGTVFLKQNPGF